MIVGLLLFLQLDRAEALLRAHRIDEAQQAISLALQQQPDSVPALFVQGRLAMARSDFESARAALARAAKLSPRSATAHFLLGFCNYVDNDFARALPALEQARHLNPKDARTLLFLALTHAGLGHPEDAEPFFEESLKVRPTAETHIAYARVLFAEGGFLPAETQIQKALALAPNSREALYEQARLDFEANRAAACIANAQRALTLEGDGVTPRQIHFLLSRAYARAGDPAKAAEHRRAFEAIPPRLIR